MLIAVARVILVTLLIIIICIIGSVYCLFSPRNPCHVYKFSYLFSQLSLLFGLKLELRTPRNIILPKNCIYISNHQNSYDMITASYAVQPRTVTVGKKSLLWIPLFGWLYWLSGNILIERNNIIGTRSTLIKIAKYIKKRNISVWIFPEGTRNHGCGLLPFKIGAFYTAIIANVPIVPICVSNTSNKIRLSRWINGLVIIEILPPVMVQEYRLKQVRILAKFCQDMMRTKLDELNAEVAIRES